MQKSIIVRDNGRVNELDVFLKEGWKVVNMCPMPSSCSNGGNTISCHDNPPTCLVIIEKD